MKLDFVEHKIQKSKATARTLKEAISALEESGDPEVLPPLYFAPPPDSKFPVPSLVVAASVIVAVLYYKNSLYA